MSGDQRVPPPPPGERERPLPEQQPKSATEDPDAPRRVLEILDSPSYRVADQDPEFLGLDNTRGLRLHVDYLKPELLLREHGIRHAIVVFGGTRIHEPVAAARDVEACRAALAADPANTDLARQLAIAERRAAKAHYYDVAREFGALVGRSGDGPQDCRVVVMTGGGPGIMEAANRGAFDVGAKSVGLNITLPREQFPNPYITPQLCFRFHYFALRKLHFLQRARALVAFPGGYGTLDELFETLTLVQTRKIRPVPVVLVGESYWRRAIDFDFLVDEGVIDPEDRELFWYAETADDIWTGIQRWHAENGGSLFPCD
ncbi:MAG: TIGR00730 family Rossman fold protein [Immundisolibacter sp.]|uniref:LOG family protein n=1 Tax=Immundisolibacter sp. TaxID=1934948 RepID=UPI003D10AB18